MNEVFEEDAEVSSFWYRVTVVTVLLRYIYYRIRSVIYLFVDAISRCRRFSVASRTL